MCLYDRGFSYNNNKRLWTIHKLDMKPFEFFCFQDAQEGLWSGCMEVPRLCPNKAHFHACLKMWPSFRGKFMIFCEVFMKNKKNTFKLSEI